MVKSTRPALFAVGLWTTALLPALAQNAAQQPAPANPAQASPAVPAPVPDENATVATVNDAKITWSQLLDSFRAESPDAFRGTMAQVAGQKAADALFGGTPQQQVTLTQTDLLAAARATPPPNVVQYLQVMIRKEALRQASAQANVQVTDAQLDERLNKLLKDLRTRGQIQANVTDAQFLAANHLTREQAKINVILPQLQISQLVEKDLEKTVGHPLGPNDFFQARHILIKADGGQPSPTSPGTPADQEKSFTAARTKLDTITKQIETGKKTFAAAAQDSSEDPGSKANGGDLGPAVRGTMVPEFEKAVFSLKPGETSKPVRTQYGYHLIKLDKAGASLTPAEREEALERYAQPRSQQFPRRFDEPRQSHQRTGADARAGRFPRRAERRPDPASRRGRRGTRPDARRRKRERDREWRQSERAGRQVASSLPFVSFASAGGEHCQRCSPPADVFDRNHPLPIRLRALLVA